MDISAALKESDLGYKITWGGWTSSDREKIENQATQSTQITMPKGDVTLTANATKEAIEYHITYNYNGGEVEIENPTTYPRTL